MPPTRIMIVEDERITAHSLEMQLKKLGHVVVANIGYGEQAVAAAEREQPDCVLMDIHLAGAMDGIAAADEIHARWGIPVIYLTAYADDETLERAGATSPYGYLIKPFDIRAIEAALRMARSRHAAEQALRASETRLSLALEAARMSDFEIDPEARQVRWNAHGLNPVELEAFDFGDLRDFPLEELLQRIDPADRSQVEAAYANSLAAGELFDVEFRLLETAGGRPVWLRVVGKQLDAGGERRVLGVVENVSDRRENQVRLAQAARIVESASEAIFVADSDWRLESVNPAYKALLEPEPEFGRLPPIFNHMTDDQRAQVRRTLEQTGTWHGEVALDPDAAVPRCFWASLARIDEAGHPGIIGVLADISSLKQAQSRIETLAYHDPLTGLPNRALARDRLEQAILRAQREQTQLAVLYIDLDHFKAINDTLGHAEGDLALIEASHRMREAIRKTDTLARLAGDEFLIIAEGGELPQGALQMADKLLRTLSRPYSASATGLPFGASVGIALYPRDGEETDTLLRAADQAMYEAKAGGGQRYRVYDPSMLQALLPVWRQENDLRRALIESEFVLHYQMQRDREGHVIGAEALARWRHPERGLLSPDAFLDRIERMGQMETFTEWAVRAACWQMAIWRRQGHPIRRVAVNAPPTTLQHCSLAEIIEATLAEHRLPGDCLEIEITESALQTGLEAFACLDRVVAMGCRIVLDDFGAGYASLVSLKRLPLGQIKIDREFVHDIETNPRSVAIVETTLALADKLGIDALAEGVETRGQLDALKAMGCRYFQGYLFDRPVEPAQLVRLAVAG